MQLRRKQDQAKCPPPPSKKSQAANWLLATFLFFDSIPHNSLSIFRELWGILSNDFANFHPFYRKTPTFGRKGHFVKKLLSQVILHTWPLPMIRAPPLLKFGFTPASYQISEESEETILHTRYFRKKDPFCKSETIEWIEMSGGEYYRFVSDPKNKSRCFVDMGDVVLECTKAEYKQYKAEDDHSSYILEQQEGWLTVSLSILEEQEFASGEESIADTAPCVEEVAVQNLSLQEMRKALHQLPIQDYQIIYELYLANPRKTIRQLSAEYGIPVMTLQDRKQKIVSRLRTKVSGGNFSKIFPYKSKKSSQ